MEDYAWLGLGRALERQSRHGEAGPCFRIAAAMRPSAEYLEAAERSAAEGHTSASNTKQGSSHAERASAVGED